MTDSYNEFDRLTAVSNDPRLRRDHEAHLADAGVATFAVTYAEVVDGCLQIESCKECSWQRVLCEHDCCSWDTTETVLTCDLCREDLT